MSDDLGFEDAMIGLRAQARELSATLHAVKTGRPLQLLLDGIRQAHQLAHMLDATAEEVGHHLVVEEVPNE